MTEWKLGVHVGPADEPLARPIGMKAHAPPADGGPPVVIVTHEAVTPDPSTPIHTDVEPMAPTSTADEVSRVTSELATQIARANRLVPEIAEAVAAFKAHLDRMEARLPQLQALNEKLAKNLADGD